MRFPAEHNVPAQHWGRVPALGTHPTFIADLASMVLEKLPSAAPRPGYLASPNENINLGPPSGAQLTLLYCSHCRASPCSLYVGLCCSLVSDVGRAIEHAAILFTRRRPELCSTKASHYISSMRPESLEGGREAPGAHALYTCCETISTEN
jgi:hypothetical protein